MALQRGLVTIKLSVCLSVRLSDKRVDCDKIKESSAQIFMPRKNVYPSFAVTKNVWWGNPFYLKFWVQLTPLERKLSFSIDIHS